MRLLAHRWCKARYCTCNSGLGVMTHIVLMYFCLQILNDNVENQTFTVTLLDWLRSHWNREATIYQDEHIP